MSEFEVKITIQKINSRTHQITSERWITPEGLAPRHLKDDRVTQCLEAMGRYPDSTMAIIENGRRILQVIPLNVAGAFQPRTQSPDTQL